MVRSRRSYLKGTVAATIAGLAGCSGNQQGDGGSNGGDGGDGETSENGTSTGNSSGKATKIQLGVGNIPGSGQQADMIKNIQQLVNEKADNVDFEIYEIQGQTGEATQKLKTQLSSEKTKPDIFNLDLIYVQQFAAAGWLEPFHKHVDNSDIKRFADPAIRASKWQGDLYTAPQFMDAGMLYWNKSHLEQAGLDPDSPPTSTKALVSMANKVLDQTDVENGFVWQGKQYEGLVCDWLEYVHEQGGWIFGGAENLHAKPGERPVTIDSDAVVQATKDMREFIYEDQISPKTVTSMVEGSSAKVFQQGNATFHRNWGYLPPILQDSEKSNVVDEWGMAPMVGGNGTLGNETYGINAYSDDPSAAAEVVKLLSMDKEINLEKFKVGRIPAVSDFYSDSDFKKVEPMGKYLDTFSDVMSQSIERPATPIYQQESQKVFAPYVSGVLNEKYSAKEGMAKAKKDLKEIENSYEGP